MAIIADMISPIVRKGIRNADGYAFYGMNLKWLVNRVQLINNLLKRNRMLCIGERIFPGKLQAISNYSEPYAAPEGTPSHR